MKKKCEISFVYVCMEKKAKDVRPLPSSYGVTTIITTTITTTPHSAPAAVVVVMVGVMVVLGAAAVEVEMAGWWHLFVVCVPHSRGISTYHCLLVVEACVLFSQKVLFTTHPHSNYVTAQ